MCRYFFPDAYGLDDTERNVASLAEQINIVFAIVLGPPPHISAH